jgi:Mg-chelatase subunit ChlI
MHAQIGTVKEPKLRVQIVTERASFDEGPAAFKSKYQQQQEALTAKIVEAQQRLKSVGSDVGCWGGGFGAAGEVVVRAWLRGEAQQRP